MTDSDPQAVKDRVIEALRQVKDPEIPMNLFDLGLFYRLDVFEGGRVEIEMTLTSPNCPVAGSLVCEVERKVGDVEGVLEADVELVWDPPWSRDRMSEAARLALNLEDDTAPLHRPGFFNINTPR